jgi:hypothetical protein
MKTSHSGWLLLLFPALIFALSLLYGCSKTEQDSKTDADLNSQPARPAWISKTPLVFIGNWDAMPIFRRRIGGNPTWQEKAYYKEHTDSAVRKYKDMGVTMMLLHFYKGFGLEAEYEHIEEAKKLAGICRQNGLRVGVYVGSTIGYETFLLEKPEASAWFVPDFMGSPVLYGDQTFRKRVYFMHPGFIEYMKKVIRVAIQDVKTDLIHFDNTSLRAEPAIFHHPLAVEHFRNFLQQKYAPEILKKRFGFSDMKYVEPPDFNGPLSKMNDPLFQEWTDFRCQQLADFYGIMKDYIHSLNPEVAVVNNPHSGLNGSNTMWEEGIDYPRLLRHTDFIWTEEGNDPAVTEEGILISKIRTYKMAGTLHNRIFTYTSDSRLEMAEAMAFNGQVLGMAGGLKEMEGNQLAQGYELPRDRKNYIAFFHKNFDCFHRITHLADVAILHSFTSLAYNNDQPYQSTWLFEQVLIQNRIPFDIIFDEQLRDLSKYKVLILADQECLDDGQLEQVRNFVKQGGGLVATEFTSLYTGWRERKDQFGLHDLFQVSPPNWNGRHASESFLNIPVQKNRFGKGRAVYIPEVRPCKPKPPAAGMISSYWKLPLNELELVDAVDWALGNNRLIDVHAPKEVAIELTRKEGKDNWMIHLLNYDTLKNRKITNFYVSLLLPEGKQVKGLELFSPDRNESASLPFSIRNGRVSFTVPVLEVYDLILITL